MRGRVEEAAASLTFDKLFELRERQRAMAGMSELSSVKRDVLAVRARMAAHGRLLLDPQVWYMQMWDVNILLAMMWTVFVTPYEISFLPNSNWAPTMNIIITSLFALDICKEFFLPYRLSHKVGGGKVSSHKAIAINYLRSWFVPDFVATVPIDVIVAAFNQDSASAADSVPFKVIKMVRLTRLLRLGRLLRASRVIQRLIEALEEFITVSYTTREVTFWTVAMLVVFHWLSCCWGLLAQMRVTQRTPALESARLAATPSCARGLGSCLSECEMDILSDLLASTTATGAPFDLVTIQYQEFWLCRAITDGVLPPESEDQHGWYYSYILSDMTLSFGIGIYPRHSIELLLAFLCAMINMVMNTFFLGVVATAMSQSDPLTRDYKARMDHLNHYLKESQAPRELRFRTREYLKYSRDLIARKSFDDVYATFSPRLAGDLHAHASLRILLSVPYFNECESDFLRSLAPKLTHHGYEATEMVKLTEASLCIVTRGTGVKGGRPITLKEYWGEDFIISSTALRDSRPASALTYMEIVCLSRSDLMVSMEMYPTSAKRLRIAALHLSLVRAPLLISRYFEMKMPDPQAQAAVRRGLTPNKRGFLGRGSESGNESGRSSVLSTTTQSIPEEPPKMFMQNQALAFDAALRNLGKRATTQQREMHGIMRVINGGAMLRGFVRDLRHSEDPDMRAQALQALQVAGDEGRLIMDERGSVVSSEGHNIHVEKGEDENPAVVAINELREQLAKELGGMKHQIQTLQIAVGAKATFVDKAHFSPPLVRPIAETASATRPLIRPDPYAVKPADISSGKALRRKQRLGATGPTEPHLEA